MAFQPPLTGPLGRSAERGPNSPIRIRPSETMRTSVSNGQVILKTDGVNRHNPEIRMDYRAFGLHPAYDWPYPRATLFIVGDGSLVTVADNLLTDHGIVHTRQVGYDATSKGKATTFASSYESGAPIHGGFQDSPDPRGVHPTGGTASYEFTEELSWQLAGAITKQRAPRVRENKLSSGDLNLLGKAYQTIQMAMHTISPSEMVYDMYSPVTNVLTLRSLLDADQSYNLSKDTKPVAGKRTRVTGTRMDLISGTQSARLPAILIDSKGSLYQENPQTRELTQIEPTNQVNRATIINARRQAFIFGSILQDFSGDAVQRKPVQEMQRNLQAFVRRYSYKGNEIPQRLR